MITEKICVVSESDLSAMCLNVARTVLQEFTQTFKPQTLAEPDELWTVKQACASLDASRPTINSWVKKGYLHPRRLGRRVYFSKNEILNQKGE